MNRRNFIKTTGLSFGSLIVLPGLAFPYDLTQAAIISFPDEVEITTEKGNEKLLGRDKRNWKLRDISVNLVPDKNSLRVDIHCPGESLKYVNFKWSIARKGTVKCLGDQWERSYGDLAWAGINQDRIMPWYFLEYDGRVTNGFGVKTGCRSMCFWEVAPDNMQLTIDVRSGGNGVVLKDRVLRAAEIVVLKGGAGSSPYTTAKKFCKLMCPAPRLPKEPVYGINDWYFAYGNNSADLIMENCNMIAPLIAGNNNKPFSVIDDGWYETFLTPNKKFGDMVKMAENMRSAGFRAGLWTRPLLVNSPVNQSRLIPPRAGIRSGKEVYLDPTIDENIALIKDYFVTYRNWGYELVKHDYTTRDFFGKWGFEMIESKDITVPGYHFYDQTLTNAEILLNLYKSIREASGNMYLIGCNTVSHLAAGIFELQRTGDDTSGREWERTRKMGVNTLGFRIAQQNSFYSVDGDCVGLTTKIPWEKNKQWMQLLAESGTALFISAQKEAVGQEQSAFMKKCFSSASKVLPVGEPLDWMETPFPQKWKLNGETVQFDWA